MLCYEKTDDARIQNQFPVLFKVHIALSSREAEVEYLEDLSARIIPLIYKVI